MFKKNKGQPVTKSNQLTFSELPVYSIDHKKNIMDNNFLIKLGKSILKICFILLPYVSHSLLLHRRFFMTYVIVKKKIIVRNPQTRN